jgi:hypothetical protein
VYKLSEGKYEGKRPLGGYSRRWQDNIKTDLTEVEMKRFDGINLALFSDKWRAVVNMVLKLGVQ